LADITLVDIGLFGLLGVVMAGPLLSSKIEHNLEIFLFSIGVLAATVAGVWSAPLLMDAVLEPVIKGIVPAVLIAGLVFHYGRPAFDRGIKHIRSTVPIKALVFFIIVGLGLVSSIITAIIAALILVEIVPFLPVKRQDRIELVILACLSIGLGAVLTPIGEPLSTIAISKLRGDPFHAGFFFLWSNLVWYIIPGVLFLGLLGVLVVEGKGKNLLRKITLPHPRQRKKQGPKLKKTGSKERAGLMEVFHRTLKIYVFVIGLIFLGAGMEVLVDKYFMQVPALGLYWVNMLSAVLDNATLAAAEVGPALSLMQIKATLMALLVSGGMLIPGNIPNIISAQKLKIKSREWARVGIPLGLGLMLFYFVWLFFLPFP
jgi:predicted cation transporter